MRPQKELHFLLIAENAEQSITISLQHTIIAGWTSRNTEKMEMHINELEALGVKRPSTTPIFYRVSSSQVTLTDTIEVIGSKSSGEVEFFLVSNGNNLYIGLGSDHTDRRVETYDITVSKQMCEKPIARNIWNFEEVKNHWDQLILRSWAVIKGEKILYQEGNVSAIKAPADLIKLYTKGRKSLPPYSLMFCGTLPAIGNISPASRFEFELEDPVMLRKICHAYDIVELPIQV